MTGPASILQLKVYWLCDVEEPGLADLLISPGTIRREELNSSAVTND